MGNEKEYEVKYDHGVKVMVQKELWMEFKRIAKQNDLTGAQVLRRMMKGYLAYHANGVSYDKRQRNENE